ncbi:PREDICTED: XK-related protein 5 [Nanorana parkeri]|uniref:XK-related protein 5 n=1 Tax=Nanorana parkeri TaxID=125878 RepID=UPI000854A228|nr:PREDICTED: XK-related protein 5 [Nanorana parkeri]
MRVAGSGWLVLVSLVLYLAERGAECAVVLHFFLTAQYLWAGWTLGLLLPGCLIQALSFAWLHSDGHPRCLLMSLVHFFQLGILKRHVECLRLALCGRGDEICQERELLMKQGDLSLLRLMEALLQALPQLLLQTYVYMEQADIYAASCSLACLLSVSWALVSFSHFLCLLRPGHLCLPWASVLCQLLWRMGMVGTRVMALVVFARAYHFWVFAVAGAHWLVMSFWLVAQQTDVISKPCYWRLFNILLGAVYVFCFINVRDGPSRYRVAIFYVIMLLENCILLLATEFLQGAVWSNAKLSVALLSGFLIGCAALIIYYTLLHPKSTEISQSCKKNGRNRTKPDASGLSSRWWGRASKKEADDLFGKEELGPKTENREGAAGDEDLPWMKVADQRHHLLLLKLAMKTGNMSKINAAFGEGGFGDLFSLGCAQNVQQSFIQNYVLDGKQSENPKTISLRSSPCMKDPGQADIGQDHKLILHECSSYVTLGNSKTGECADPKDVQNHTNDLGYSGKSSGVDVSGSPNEGPHGSRTLYFSAHAEGMVPPGKDSHLDVPETGLKLQTDSPLKELPEMECVNIPVMCVSPILSLAANCNFQRSIGDDTGSLCEESDVSHDDSGLPETEEPWLKRGFCLLPPSVRGRLVQDEKPCFTSTPKPPATNGESEPRESAKARRRLDQLTEGI